MSSEVSKQEYLKRYLEGDKSKRKKKSKPKSSKISRMKIIDQDIGIKSLGIGDKDVEDLDDEAPVIAEVVDERPLEVKVKELYESSRWKKISTDGDSRSEASVFQEKEGKPNQEHRRARHDSDSDISPPRHKIASSSSPQNRSSLVRPRHDSDSDLSPPRSKDKAKKCDSADSSRISTQKRRLDYHDSDSDFSPPRQKNRSSSQCRSKELKSPMKRRHDSGSDISPPRLKTVKKEHDSPGSRRSSSKRGGKYDQGSDSDLSPPRKGSLVDVSNKRRQSLHSSQRHNADSDLSPPRGHVKKDKEREYLGARPHKALSGLSAGLQCSSNFRKEFEDLRRRERSQMDMMDESVSGRNAETVLRDRKTGLRRDLDQEQRDKDEANKKSREHEKKYMEWGKGVVQKQSQMEKLNDDLHEMSKPLARYEDDTDLDAQLRAVIHDEDPMSAYIRKKKEKDKPSMPVYNGPPPPPNRFNILPGYRWDGVNRSNGFEKKYFDKLTSSKATEEQAYLWSIQDM